MISLPSLSRPVLPPAIAVTNPCFFLQLLDHDFMMDHSLALDILPISVHSTSCLRSQAQRTGHLTPEDLLPWRLINLLRVQIEVTEHARIGASASIWSHQESKEGANGGKGQVMFVGPFSLQ